MGSIFGPLAYYSGGNINESFRLSVDLYSLLILGSLWGILFQMSIIVYQKLHPFGEKHP